MLSFIKNFADRSIESPSLGKAFVFFLLPFIFSLIIALIIGISIDLASIGFNAFLELIRWFLSAVVLFVIVHLFKGKAASGKFKGILSGLAFRYVFWLILMILVFVVIFFAVPEFYSIVAAAQNATNSAEAFELIGSRLDSLGPQNELVLFSSFGLILVATIIIILLTFYLVYQLIAFSGSGSPRQNLLILLIWVIIQSIIISFL